MGGGQNSSIKCVRRHVAEIETVSIWATKVACVCLNQDVNINAMPCISTDKQCIEIKLDASNKCTIANKLVMFCLVTAA